MINSKSISMSYNTLQEAPMEMVQQNYESPLYDSTSFIPENYSFITFKTPSDISDGNNKISSGQYIIPLKNHMKPFRELLLQFLKSLSLQNSSLMSKVRLTLKKGKEIKMEETPEDLRKLLCRQSPSGIAIYIHPLKSIIDQAAINHFISNEPDFENQSISKWFLLLNNQQPFSIKMQKSASVQKLVQNICKCLYNFYGHFVSDQDISFYSIKSIKKQKQTEGQNKNQDKETVFSWLKNEKLEGDRVQLQIIENEQAIIGVEIQDKEGVVWPRVQVSNEEYLIFFISKDYQIKLKFAHISKFTIQQLLRHLNIQKHESFGIKIVDEIFPPYKLINDASKYFQTGQGKYVKNVECRLVSEKQIFYESLKTLNEHFVLPKQMITKKKQPLFDKCRDLAERRSKQYQQRNENYFINVEQISPITMYTSSVQVIDDDHAQLLYKCVNNNLRTSNFGLVRQFKDQWKYKYSATLIKCLEKISSYCTENKKIPVYRGIKNHKMEGQIGQIYVAKEFMSTSQYRQKAYNFVKTGEYGTLLTIHGFSGRSISQFSVYQKQKEILFKPYSYFRIISKIDYGKIRQIELQQIEEKKFSCNSATFVLWVDDKLRQGEKMINTLDFPMNTTFLFQLKSTQELRQWIKDNQNYIKNPKMKIIVITNMKRVQNNVTVCDAGAFSAKLAFEQIKNSQIIFYIGHIEGTKKALAESGLNPQNFIILNKKQQLKDYLMKECAPIENQEEKQQEFIQICKSSVLKFFDKKSSDVSKSN